MSERFVLETDACDVGTSAVLLQMGEDDLLHPVAYFSYKFKVYERKYSTIEKEALSLVKAVKHFEVYLSPSPHVICVYTDHNPLVFLNRMCQSNRRLLAWSLILQEYNLEIKHIKGKDNICADALSRC